MTTIIRSLMAAFALALVLGFLSSCMADPPERLAAHQTLARWEDQRHAPEDSLLAMIKAKDAHVRLRALRSAGLMGQRNVVPAMIEALQDPSETVGRQAAFSLGLMGDIAAAPALEALLANPAGRLHLAAVRGLAQLPHQGRGLLTAATSEDPLVAAAAWDGLRNIADQADSTLLVAAIISGLGHEQGDVLWRVLRCAERLPAVELIPHLSPHVRSQNPQVRVHAYRALARQDHISALKAVLQGQHLQGVFKGRNSLRTRIAACRALGALAALGFSADSPLGGEERNFLTETLIEGAGHDNPHLAATALDAMEKLAANFELPPEAAQQESLLPVWRIRLGRAAHSHLQNEHPAVGAAAIRSWAALRGSGSEEKLHQLLSQATSAIDLEAILHALARHTDSPLEILSTFASGQAETTVRVAALEALNHLASQPAHSEERAVILDRLTQAAADPDFVIAATATRFLGDFPERLALVALLEAWDTTYPEGEAEVKRAVLAALSSLGGQVKDLGRQDLPEGIDDRLLSGASGVLRQAFDSPDLRIRLEGREAARATDLLPSRLIPGEDSLRATLPSFQRNPAQPSVRTPFSASKVRCNTEYGSFVIRLDGDNAPNTCAMFLDLIERGFYDDLTFHRIVADFVVQGGDPRGDGWGGPGYTIRSEWSRARFTRAAVGIAHDGKDTGGSQFFVTLSEQPHLNGRYTIFGEVIEGMEVVDQMKRGERFHLEILY